jgi:hypothetical protein
LSKSYTKQKEKLGQAKTQEEKLKYIHKAETWEEAIEIFNNYVDT